MSLLSDHDAAATQNSGLSWDPTGRLTAVDDLTDSRISRSSFYKDVFRPAWKSLEEAAATLLLEWFSGSLNTIGQLVNWYNAKQTAQELRYYQAHPKRHQTPEALPIPLEAPIGLRKVMGHPGETGNRESFTVETTESRKPEGSINPLKKTNPWLEATKKQQCVLDIQPPKAEKPARKSMKSSKKPYYTEEPNRGLDDIYTSPVNGFFAEEKDFSFKKPAPPVKKAVLPKLNTQAIAALIDAELDQIMPKRRTNAASEKAEAKSDATADGSLQGFPGGTESQALSYPYPIDGREPHESEFIPGLPLDDLDLESELENEPEIGQNITHQHLIEQARPVPVPIASHFNQPQLSQPKPNQNGASVMLAKAKASNLEFKRTMPVYQEMKTEMSGADHMVRNNRILHNSISNLADSYFKKAAQEEREQSNLY